jgi:hypothetical protein
VPDAAAGALRCRGGGAAQGGVSARPLSALRGRQVRAGRGGVDARRGRLAAGAGDVGGTGREGCRLAQARVAAARRGGVSRPGARRGPLHHAVGRGAARRGAPAAGLLGRRTRTPAPRAAGRRVCAGDLTSVPGGGRRPPLQLGVV